ncbi:MAG: hypothetical protein V3S20_07430 [Dehalococcoidia bacterium]
MEDVQFMLANLVILSGFVGFLLLFLWLISARDSEVTREEEERLRQAAAQTEEERLRNVL